MDEPICSSKQSHDVPEATPEPSVRKAAFPFDEGDADATLRTSDNVEFGVHRVILSLASPIFKDMFSMPQPQTGGSDPIPVAEDETTLDTFLRICYPIQNAKPTSLAQIRRVLAAAVKYDVPLVADQMRDALVAPEFLELQPLVVFTIACVFHMEEVAQAAAETILTVHNFKTSPGWGTAAFNYPKLDDVSAGAYSRLLQLYQTRTKVMEPLRKRGKNKKSNNTFLEPQYTVNFQGIIPLCRLSLPRTLATTKPQLGSVSDPFTDTTGDLILRTSDAFNFYVHRNIITFASPTFLDTLVAMETEDGSGTPVIPIYQVEESAAVLDVLLRICYPIPHPQPTNPDMFLAVIFAAHKYGMSKALQILKGGWPELVEASPMRLYFAAVELGWMKEGKACGDKLASRPTSDVHAIYVPEMESICSAPYRNLLVYIDSKRRGSSGELQWDQGPHGALGRRRNKKKVNRLIICAGLPSC